MAVNWTATGVAAILSVVGFFIGKPETDFIQPGEWVQRVNRTSMSMYEAHLMPGQKITLDFNKPAFARDGSTTTCMLYEATYGKDTIGILTWTRAVINMGDKNWRQGDPVMSREPSIGCLNQKTPVIQLSSPTKRQVVRVVVFYPSRDYEGAIAVGYKQGLCDTWAYDTCSRMPLSPVSAYFTPAEQKAHNTDKLLKGLVVAGAGVGVLLLGHIKITIYIIYQILRSWFPSKRGQALNQAVQRSIDGTMIDASVTHAFNQTPNNPFSRQQDIDDMREATEKLQAATTRKKEIEQGILTREREKAAREAAAVRDFEAKIGKLNERKTKSDIERAAIQADLEKAIRDHEIATARINELNKKR